jgi:lambda family phage portal protein
MIDVQNPVQILDSAGRPMPSAASYKASDSLSQELKCWAPPLTSADKAMLPEKAKAEGRAKDLVRNNGYARGAVQNQKDRIVGAKYQLQLKPLYKLLGIDAKVAAQWASIVEVAFHAWANDPDCWVDAQRKRTFTQFIREGAATEMVQGECFTVRQWRPSPTGYATCFTSVEPERVSNPNGYGLQNREVLLPNGNRLRAGVEFDAWGAAVAYYIRTRHPQDFGPVGGGLQGQWDRVTVTNDFGWRQVIHLFEPEGADQTRGFSTMASTLQKLKMMDIQEDLELQLSQLSTAFAMYIKTPLGRQRAKEIIGADEGPAAQQAFMQMCMEAQEAHYGAKGLSINGVKLPVLYPDDEIGVLQPHNQARDHEQFKEGLMRQNARGWGMSFEEASGDFSKTSYSSARAAMQIAWSYVLSKRANIADKQATLMFRLWFDEAIVRGSIPLPAGVKYWPDNSIEMGQKFSWLTNCNWLGAGKIVIDEFKQAKANEVALGTFQAGLPDILAENGTDTETLLDDSVRVREMFQERDLPLPEYLGGIPRGTVDPATQAANHAADNQEAAKQD